MSAPKRKAAPLPRLTEAQAWRVIAIMFKRPNGVCYAIHSLAESGVISEVMCDTLNARVDAEFKRLEKSPNSPFLWPLIMASSDSQRMAFAAKQARRAARRLK